MLEVTQGPGDQGDFPLPPNRVLPSPLPGDKIERAQIIQTPLLHRSVWAASGVSRNGPRPTESAFDVQLQLASTVVVGNSTQILNDTSNNHIKRTEQWLQLRIACRRNVPPTRVSKTMLSLLAPSVSLQSVSLAEHSLLSNFSVLSDYFLILLPTGCHLANPDHNSLGWPPMSLSLTRLAGLSVSSHPPALGNQWIICSPRVHSGTSARRYKPALV